MSAKAFDLVVVGAGPAGMAAALEGIGHGLRVAVIDEQSAPGGQIYRAVDAVAAHRAGDLGLLGDDYAHGRTLSRPLADAETDGKLTYLAGYTLWQVDRDGTLWLSDGQAATSVTGRTVILATGAQERPVPVPGWTLPGVMTAGAAQILLKTAGMVPSGPVAVHGSGPLLLLVADQLLAAGAEIAVVAETTAFADYLRAAPKLPGALRSMDYLKKGFAMRRRLKAAGVRFESGVRNVRIGGESRAERLSFETGGRRHDVRAETVLLHQGVVPNTQATRQLRLRHLWHAEQRYWYPRTDRFGATGAEAIFIAGDGAGILGARAAEASGRLAALAAAHRIGKIDEKTRDRDATPLFAERDRHAAVRPLLDALFPPPRDILDPPDDDTIVCRCEEITAGQVRRAAKLGAPGPNQLKAFLRAGMGPCQGRMCGLTVTEILAAAHRTPPAEIGAYRIRPPLKPVTLSELAAMETDEAEITLGSPSSGP